jgi:hypothetical protein
MFLRPPLRAPAGALAAALAALATAATARANPRPLPYTYIYETLPEGEAEVELYTDLAPIRLVNEGGAPAWYLASQFQTEIEYGLTDRLELGLYVTTAVFDPGVMFAPSLPEGTGVKQRLRYRFGDAGRWPIDLAVYGEVTENQQEIELEGKIILQRRLGPLRLAANAWVEREYYFNSPNEWVLNPTAGVVFEKSALIQPGIEYWMHAEHSDGGGWGLGAQHYLGPTVILQFGKIWWSNGAYVRINGVRTPAIDTNDPYAAFMFRTIIGLNF